MRNLKSKKTIRQKVLCHSWKCSLFFSCFRDLEFFILIKYLLIFLHNSGRTGNVDEIVASIFLTKGKNMLKYSLPRFSFLYIVFSLLFVSSTDANTKLRLLRDMLIYGVSIRRNFSKLQTLFLSVCHAWEHINYVCPQFLLKVLSDEKTLHNFYFPFKKIYGSLLKVI